MLIFCRDIDCVMNADNFQIIFKIQTKKFKGFCEPILIILLKRYVYKITAPSFMRELIIKFKDYALRFRLSLANDSATFNKSCSVFSQPKQPSVTD